MLIILGLCLTLVVFNKEDLTHIPIIISLFLIVVVGILIIPIGGLTSFHIVLVTRGRTTNEQVTGKFRTGVNPFDEGCWQNWKRVVCASTVPSYIKFRRNKLHKRDYMDNMVVVNYAEVSSRLQIKSSSKVNTPIKPIKNINHQVARSSEAEAAAFLNNQVSNLTFYLHDFFHLISVKMILLSYYTYLYINKSKYYRLGLFFLSYFFKYRKISHCVFGATKADDVNTLVNS